jgi:hypothetical protein
MNGYDTPQLTSAIQNVITAKPATRPDALVVVQNGCPKNQHTSTYETASMIDREWEHEHRAMIAVAEACWRGSYSWHVLDWMCWKLRCKYPVVDRRDAIISFDPVVT